MPNASVLNFRGTIAAGGTIPNLFDTQPGGQMFRTLPRRAFLQIFAVEDGATVPATPLQCALTSGNVVKVPDGNGPVPTFTANQGPIEPDHELISFTAEALDQVILSLRNPGATASNFRFKVKYTF